MHLKHRCKNLFHQVLKCRVHQDNLVVHHSVTTKECVSCLDKQLLVVVHLVLLVLDVKLHVRLRYIEQTSFCTSFFCKENAISTRAVCADSPGSCQNGAACVDQPALNTFVCVCLPAWTGDFCDFPGIY